MKEESGFKMIISGVFSGLCISLIAVIIFAFALYVTPLSDGIIKTVNQIIKVVSVFFACVFCLRGRLGYLKGGIVGLAVFVLTYLVFALFVGAKVFSGGFVTDLVFGTLVGVISGIIAVNFKKTA